MSKKLVSVLFASEEDSLALTGFIHNAIVPVGATVGSALPGDPDFPQLYCVNSTAHFLSVSLALSLV